MAKGVVWAAWYPLPYKHVMVKEVPIMPLAVWAKFSRHSSAGKLLSCLHSLWDIRSRRQTLYQICSAAEVTCYTMGRNGSY